MILMKMICMLLALVMGGGAFASDCGEAPEQLFSIVVENRAEDEVFALTGEYGLRGESLGLMGCQCADGSAMPAGDVNTFDICTGDSPAWEDLSGFTLNLSVEDAEGTAHPCQPAIRLDAERGGVYRYTLTGSAEAGYRIEESDGEQ